MFEINEKKCRWLDGIWPNYRQCKNDLFHKSWCEHHAKIVYANDDFYKKRLAAYQQEIDIAFRNGDESEMQRIINKYTDMGKRTAK